MNIANIIAGPAVGAVIGYFTNYLAVKMLFRPHRAVKIGSFTLPFTPGIIPKRKAALGKALGNAIAEKLITSSDLTESFLSEDAANSVADTVVNALVGSSATIKDIALCAVSEDKYDDFNAHLVDAACQKALRKADELCIGELIADEGIKAIASKISENKMLAMFINDDFLMSFKEPITEYINAYIAENGDSIIRPIISDELDKLQSKRIADIPSKLSLNSEQLRKTVSSLYMKLMSKNLTDVISKIDIRAIVEKRVDEMNVEDIEELVLSVMKNELNAIVRLGALIGLVIGIINIFL